MRATDLGRALGRDPALPAAPRLPAAGHTPRRPPPPAGAAPRAASVVSLRLRLVARAIAPEEN